MPTSSEGGYIIDVEPEKRPVELQIVNTWGAEVYDRLRFLAYPGADIILICFSVVDPDKFKDVEEMWLPEVCHFCPGVPFLLVGCKTDLRHHRQTIDELMKNGKRPISKKEGEEMGRRIGARAYIECSAKNGEGVIHIFRTAAAIVYPPEPEPRQCVIS
jgi:Ras homolog gene family, member A